MKSALHNRFTATLLAIIAVGAVGGIGVALAAGSSGGAAMRSHTSVAPRPATPPTTAPAPATTTPAPTRVTAAGPAVTAPVAVSIVNFKFTPAAVTVTAGTTVTWTNKDAIGHTVNFHASGINSPSILNQGDRFSHTFTTPGTYAYICDIHPFMHGTVVVTP